MTTIWPETVMKWCKIFYCVLKYTQPRYEYFKCKKKKSILHKQNTALSEQNFISSICFLGFYLFLIIIHCLYLSTQFLWNICSAFYLGQKWKGTLASLFQSKSISSLYIYIYNTVTALISSSLFFFYGSLGMLLLLSLAC